MNAPAWFAARPPFERAVLVLYAARAVFGWLVALPLVRVVGASGVATLPDGDAALFQSGALWLLELLRQEQVALRAGLQTAVVSGLIALAVLSVPSALLFASAPRALDRAPPWPRAAALAPRFAVLGVIEAFAVGALVVALAIASSGVAPLMARLFDERGRDIATFVFCVPGLLVAMFVAIAADVARTALVREEVRVMPAVSWALSAVRDVPGPLFGGFALATGVSALLVALAARATDFCSVGQPGAARVAAVFFIHQVTLFGLVAAQAWWVRRLDRVVQ